ncbi:MAG: glycosyltransferase family 2 protein [Verrucomicrobia bacterium]|nr:glycosyltransferase family 2 protein [Verrucomicrobiota bacterium]MCH8526566.1 glycosyltransferase family 2 protein [Kiritimatiellia bacterium]
MPTLSVLLPVFNESEAIVPVLLEVGGVMDQTFPGDWEILAVDDGSTDDTPARILEAAKIFPAIRLISLENNVGQSGALWMGFRQARSEWIATLDADGQNDPADLPKLWAARADADAVFGFRAKRKDTWSKRYGSKFANAVRNLILKEDITDTGCAVKIFRKSLTDELMPWNGMHRFFGSLFRMQGAKILQMPVNHRPRAAGASKYTNWGRLKKTVRDLFAMRWLRSRYVQVRLKPEATP